MTLMSAATGPEESGFAPTSRDCPCDSCKQLRYEPNGLKYGVIHSWSYKPRRWSMKSVRDDKYSYFLGVELETDNYSKSRGSSGLTVYSRIDENTAVSMKKPANLWTAKSDSSVSGPEFVSHPATLDYWHAKKPQLEEMFSNLLHAGYRSHDNNKAGMHVNISRNAFKDWKHLYRFLTLLHYSPAWALRMSQRTEASAKQWAPLNMNEDGESTGMALAKNRARIAKHAFSSTWLRSTDKYNALNIPPPGQGRFEFRLPRGTLRIDRFYKNLEWTVAMIEYTRTSQVATSRPIPFMQYVRDNQDEYPNLMAFMVERGAKLQKATYRPRKPKPATAAAPALVNTPVVSVDEAGNPFYRNSFGQLRRYNIILSTWETVG